MKSLRQSFRSRIIAFGALLLLTQPAIQALAQGRSDKSVETIVMIRHGEKPDGGLGQLNCKGLNRSLALPEVLLSRFGKPDAIYAPNPAVQLHEGGSIYSYIRPLATIEPTAIREHMGVNTQVGFNQVAQLQKELTQPAYANALIFVAWEHGFLHGFAQQFLKSYGEDPSAVPPWPGNDYDTIYVFKLTQNGRSAPRLSFQAEKENLNGTLSDTCPNQ